MNAVVVYAGFVVSVLTLAVLIYYAYLTRGMERAAKEQSEGLSKPALTLRAIPRSPTSNENLLEILNRKMLTRAEPNAKGYLKMVNIGNGPALRAQFEIHDVSLPSGKPWIGGAAYVQAGGALPLPIQCGNSIKDKHQKITCSYASLSGTKYESVIELNGDEIENSDFSSKDGAQPKLRKFSTGRCNHYVCTIRRMHPAFSPRLKAWKIR